MSAPFLTGRRRVRQQLVGVLFLAVLASLVALTVALYQKAFTDVTTVFVEADRVGNQLTKGADVKHRGVLVGEVRKVTSDGSRARLELALQPEQAERIPGDARVQMLPKTLFGEKFVAVVSDDDSRAEPLDEGDVIPQDRSETARETSQALDDLLPLLQALKPQELSTTLNALSTTLRGRGDRIGESLVLTESYLREINPELPTLAEDFRGIADFAQTLETATPDLVGLLDNSSALARNLVDTEEQLSTFLTTTAAGNGELEEFLGQNEERLVRLAADSLPSLEVYAKYSPEYPCLAQGLVKQERVASEAFGGLQPGLHITVEFTRDQGGYLPEQDEPLYGEDRGPACTGLPPNPVVPDFPATYEPVDGYCDEEERASPGIDSSNCRTPEDESNAPGEPQSQPALALAAPLPATRDRDRAAVAAAAGPVMGVAPQDVPDLALLLFGPVARGTTVAVRPGAR